MPQTWRTPHPVFDKPKRQVINGRLPYGRPIKMMSVETTSGCYLYDRRRLVAQIEVAADELALRQHRPTRAAAGTPDDGRPKFKSEWERRTAAALDRLGVAWLYEPDRLSYRAWNDTLHAYIPDFALPDFNGTYIEVKGPNGADAADAEKMRRVLATYRGLTLLLWDAMAIEYVEDCVSVEMLLPLLNTTRIAA